jgi:hypothetical protein
LHGTSYPQAALDDLPDEVELRTQRLPSETEWKQAATVAACVFGLTVSPPVSSANLQRLLGEVRGKVEGAREDARRLAERLAEVGTKHGSGGAASSRLGTARNVASLLATLQTAPDDRVVSLLATSKPATTFEAMGSSLSRSRDLVEQLGRVKWNVLEAAMGLADGRKAAADGLRSRLAQALGHDELQEPLAPVLGRLEDDAATLLADNRGPGPKWVRVGQGEGTRLDGAELRSFLGDLSNQAAKDPAVRVSIQFQIDRPKDPS